MKSTVKLVLSIFFVLALFVAFGISANILPRLSGALSMPMVGGWLVDANPVEDLSARTPQQDPGGDKLILGGSYVLNSDQVLNGDLVVLGGVASLEEGSLVQGDVVLMGGTITIDGSVEGDVNALGGLVTLGSAAHVEGDLNAIAAQMNREEGAQVDGAVNTAAAGPFSIITPGSLQIPGWEGVPPIALPLDVRSPELGIRLNPLWDGLWWLLRSFIWAALAVLVALFAPKSIGRAAQAAVESPVTTGGLGCLTILISPLVLIVLAITICGLPISLIGALVLWLAWVFGVIVLGAETGKRLAEILRVDWAAPVAAGIGVFGLTLVMNGIDMIVPCVGWLAPAVIGVIGFGAVLLTRFGTQPFGSDPKAGDIAPAPALSQDASEIPASLDEPENLGDFSDQ